MVLYWGIQRQHFDGIRVRVAQETLSGVKDVKIVDKEASFISRFNEANMKSSSFEAKQHAFSQTPRLWLEIVGIVGLAILAISAIVQSQETRSLIPTLALFTVATFRLMPCANRLLVAFQSLRYSEPIMMLLRTELSKSRPQILRTQSFECKYQKDIHFQKVAFKYQGAPKNSLDDISFQISKGESIGIIGESGSGKSTLADIMMGILSPSSDG